MSGHIYLSDSKCKKNSNRQSISVEDELDEIHRDDFLKLKYEILAFDVDEGLSIPLYDSLWQYIMNSYDGALLENILLYERLKTKISNSNINQIYVDVSDEMYLAIVRDLENNTDNEFVYLNGEEFQTSGGWWPFSYRELARFSLSILDQIFYLLKSLVRGKRSENKGYDSIVFPYPGRDESIYPVISAMESKTLVVLCSRSTMPNLLGSDYPYDWSEEETRTFNSFSSIKIILSQIWLLLTLLKETNYSKSLEQNLNELIEDSRGHCLEHTIRYSLNHAFEDRLIDFKRAIISKHIFKKYGSAKRVITGSNGTMYRIIRFFAEKSDLENFYLPHSVAHPVETEYPPNPGTKMILAGKFDQEVMEADFPEERLPELIPLGRPYFRTALSNNTNIPNGSREFTVLLATQKLEKVRDEFVCDILNQFHESDKNPKIIIKVHPAERKSHYHNLLSEIASEKTHSVSITNESLDYHIKQSSIVFTINSNVGIESMILGTPSVSYNKWRPGIPSYPYATKGPGVLLENSKELETFIQKLDDNYINELSEEMTVFARENYYPKEGSAKNIAKFIES